MTGDLRKRGGNSIPVARVSVNAKPMYFPLLKTFNIKKSFYQPSHKCMGFKREKKIPFLKVRTNRAVRKQITQDRVLKGPASSGRILGFKSPRKGFLVLVFLKVVFPLVK